MEISLECGHKIVRTPDLISEITTKLSKLLPILCPICNKKLSFSDLTNKINSPEVSSKLTKCNKCEKTLIKKKIEPYSKLKLKCGHKFCNKCFRNAFFLNSQQEKEKKCFYPNCQEIIPLEIIQIRFDIRISNDMLKHEQSYNFQRCIICKEKYNVINTKSNVNNTIRIFILPCCERELCEDCLEFYNKKKILECPRQKCRQKININDLILSNIDICRLCDKKITKTNFHCHKNNCCRNCIKKIWLEEISKKNCDLKCTYCAEIIKDEKIIKEIFSDKEYENYLNKLKNINSEIYLCNRNEAKCGGCGDKKLFKLLEDYKGIIGKCCKAESDCWMGFSCIICNQLVEGKQLNDHIKIHK